MGYPSGARSPRVTLSGGLGVPRSSLLGRIILVGLVILVGRISLAGWVILVVELSWLVGSPYSCLRLRSKLGLSAGSVFRIRLSLPSCLGALVGFITPPG